MISCSPVWRNGPSPITTSTYRLWPSGGGDRLGDLAQTDRNRTCTFGRRVGLDRDDHAVVNQRLSRVVGLGWQLASYSGVTASNSARLAAVADTYPTGRGGAAVARLIDVDLVAEVAEVHDFLQDAVAFRWTPKNYRSKFVRGAPGTSCRRKTVYCCPNPRRRACWQKQVRRCGCRCTGSGPGSGRA